MAAAPAMDGIVQRHLGLPPDLLSTSLLSWEGIGELAAALRLRSGGLLVDLACGRGGYGIEIARRAGARLVGIDFSAEAVRQAHANAGRQKAQARFEVGTLEATGLADACADAVMCIDAVQFAKPVAAAFAEAFRVLRPGGRMALTTWEAVDRADERFPAGLRTLDVRANLAAAGFVELTVEERPAWLERELAMWREAASLEPGDDPALRALRDEGVGILEMGQTRRVIAAATRP
jgi:cyclopropane fatty-acyl-phospholipid synthase-like methyltransferase